MTLIKISHTNESECPVSCAYFLVQLNTSEHNNITLREQNVFQYHFAKILIPIWSFN